MLTKAQTPKQYAQLLLENQIKFGEFGQKVNELIAYAQEKIEQEQLLEGWSQRQSQNDWQIAPLVNAVEKIVKEMPQLINQCIIENNEDEEGNGEIPRTTNKHIEDDEDEEGDGVEDSCAGVATIQLKMTMADTTEPIEDTPQAVNFRNCGCRGKISTSTRNRLIQARKRGVKDMKLVIRDIEFMSKEVLESVCWLHCREFCSTLGMKVKDGGRNALRERRHQSMDQGWDYHTKRSNGWLFEIQRSLPLIQEEIQMYLHHRRMVNGQPNLGWLRSAYYTQIQQIAQQDPAYYALVAATSPNKTWRQISYPYYMKAVLPGEFIQFQHLNLNLKTIY
ncbi:hypothetical protein BDZ91DRAFT_769014 [Kalaharituber pfeilii]|nr:hypothetical protein BDZ91DRAFT_769014 [Kalaharituber pfeilii]